MGYLKAKRMFCFIIALIGFSPCSQSQEASSPVVSFSTLPALQANTPIPNSTHVPGDFNGDGTSDLLWFNPELSQVGYWSMSPTLDFWSSNNVTRTNSRVYNVTPDYFVGAVGDFNNDGYADIVFTSENRDLWLWTNNKGGGFISEYMGTYPSEWQLVGAGDVNGDGYDDLLWLNPSGCQFAYWTMQGTNRIGFKIIPISCGYYPIGIGYYNPSNRISILWTSPAKDLYIWDSTPAGFKSYNLGEALMSANMDFANVWAIGGGFMGKDIGIMWSKEKAGSKGGFLSRTFDEQGNQIRVFASASWHGGADLTPLLGSGGYLIQGGGVNITALYVVDQASYLLKTDGIPGPRYPKSSNNASWGNWNKWTYPSGWWVVGAPVNKAAAQPGL